MEPVLKRAEERVREAIVAAKITRNPKRIELEISSYPVALLLVSTTENSVIKKRYALAEAKQARGDLAYESKEKILHIAENFEWKITLSPKQGSEVSSDFVLHFTDYLRNTTHLSTDSKWQLINRILVTGSVNLNQADGLTLLGEEIRRHIET